jgi:hypothetical protein
VAATPRYPVYVSPDGQTEQAAPTPAREVQLKHAGWRLKTEPRKKTGADLGRWKKPAKADSEKPANPDN